MPVKQEQEEGGAAETIFGDKERRRYQNISIEKLFLGELNERIEPGDIQGLADSIKKVGVLEPLLVRPVGSTQEVLYEIVAGGRRYRAAKVAGQTSLPCTVKDMNDMEALKASFQENEARKSASPLEYGALCYKMAQRCGNIEDVASHLGKSIPWVEARVNQYELWQKTQVVPVNRRSGDNIRSMEEKTLGLVDANLIMRTISSSKVKRYMARLGEDVQDKQTEIIRQLTQEFPKLDNRQKKKLIIEFKKDPTRSIPQIAKEVIERPMGLKLSISFDATTSQSIEEEAEREELTPERWIKEVVKKKLSELRSQMVNQSER